jgi:hypothetical protein
MLRGEGNTSPKFFWNLLESVQRNPSLSPLTLKINVNEKFVADPQLWQSRNDADPQRCAQSATVVIPHCRSATVADQ